MYVTARHEKDFSTSVSSCIDIFSAIYWTKAKCPKSYDNNHTSELLTLAELNNQIVQKVAVAYGLQVSHGHPWIICISDVIGLKSTWNQNWSYVAFTMNIFTLRSSIASVLQNNFKMCI